MTGAETLAQQLQRRERTRAVHPAPLPIRPTQLTDTRKFTREQRLFRAYAQQRMPEV